MPIKKEDYQMEYGIPHIIYEQVRLNHCEEAVKRFKSFMYGQTVMIRPDGVPGIYAWDYERWFNQGMKDHQGLDWD
jgi:hypothetical protein